MKRAEMSRRSFTAGVTAAIVFGPRRIRADPPPAVTFQRLQVTPLGRQVSFDYVMPVNGPVYLEGVGWLPPEGHFEFGTTLSKLVFKDEHGRKIPGASFDLQTQYDALRAHLQAALVRRDSLSAGKLASTLGFNEQATTLLDPYAKLRDPGALLNVADIQYARGRSVEAASNYTILAQSGSVEGKIGLSKLSLAAGDFDFASAVLASANAIDPVKIRAQSALVGRIAANEKAIGVARTSLDDVLEILLDPDLPSNSDVVAQDQQSGVTTLGITFDNYLTNFVGLLYRSTNPYLDQPVNGPVGSWKTQYRHFKSTPPGDPQGRVAFRVTRFVGAQNNGFQFDYALQQLTAPGVPWSAVPSTSPLRAKAKALADSVYTVLKAVLA